MADHSARIAEIQELLRTGVKSSTTDGQTVTFDKDQLNKELRELMAGDDTHKGRRPRAAAINLGGF